ncbi:hypothetical protein SESBI_09820 [Sesbania bispinosa]|nr:hypothetical protein SESBI_09820 [Sesbania bispinosa]
MPCITNNNNPIMLHNSTGLGHLMEIDHNNNNDGSSSSSSSALKAKIMAHPHYHRLLTACVNCQKIGAPAEACACAAGSENSMGEDPALDQFMEAYCEMLIKNGSSEDVDVHNNIIDPQAEDQELKVQLLRKYSGYLGSLKHEFMKKKKKGKLPKEARHKLLEWWSRHYKWPYPSESQKLALAESTGLDQKQINNWFINQRKRHWKPSEDMQFVVVDPSHPHYYMDNVLGNPFPMDLSHTML